MTTLIDVVIKVYVVLLGLSIGSFLNVLIYRLPKKISIAKGSSFCPNCNHKLSWLDLFPVLSFVFLFGKCKYCKDKISTRYPLIELLNAVFYYLIYLKYGLSLLSIAYAIICSCLIVLSFIDIDHKIILDRFHIIIGVLAIATVFLTPQLTITERIIGTFAISLPIFFIAWLTGGMGMGDVKLLAVCGFLLGWKQILLTMIIASVAAALVGVFLIYINKAGKKSEIPFGPFIALAVLICILAGNEIINFYLNVFI